MSSLASKLLTASEVCSQLKISRRAFKQMRALEAVDAANGTGKAARYTSNHVEQALRLLKLMKSAGLSMPVAALRLRAGARLCKASKASKLRLAVEACFRGGVYSLGAGVYLTVDPQLRSAQQNQLLKELKRCAAIARATDSRKPKAAASELRSRVHRAR